MRHPHVSYQVAAAEVVLVTVLGAVVTVRNVAVGVVVVGLFAALAAAAPAHWSERHCDQAQAQLDAHRQRRNQLARRHPAFFLVALPLFCAVDGAVRWNTGHHQHTLANWLIPAVVGLPISGILGAALVLRARRSQSLR